MMNSTLISAHMLMQQQCNLLSSPRALPSREACQLWQSPQAASLELTRALTSSPPVSSILAGDFGQTEKREETLSHSELDDDSFFHQYAKNKLREKVNKNEPFPLKLYRILHEAKNNGDDDIISFCPGGRSFMIHDIDKFVEKLMPKYFTSHRMTSFQRQLNLYGFRRRLRGDDKGGFFHDSFREGQRNLALTIKRKAQNFKIPPHLLSNPNASAVTTYTPSPTVPKACASQRFMLGSPTFHLEQSFGSPDMSLPREETPCLETPLVQSQKYQMQTLPSLPALHNPIGRGLATTQAPTACTTEYLKLAQQLRLAKERAAIKQQVAMAAIQRLSLVNRFDLA